MSITPKSPAISQQGWVPTWVTSQWKNRPIPGHFSAEINTECPRRLQLTDRDCKDRAAQYFCRVRALDEAQDSYRRDKGVDLDLGQIEG